MAAEAEDLLEGGGCWGIGRGVTGLGANSFRGSSGTGGNFEVLARLVGCFVLGSGVFVYFRFRFRLCRGGYVGIL